MSTLMQKVVEVILTETANFGASPFYVFHRDTSRESWSRDIPVGPADRFMRSAGPTGAQVVSVRPRPPP